MVDEAMKLFFERRGPEVNEQADRKIHQAEIGQNLLTPDPGSKRHHWLGQGVYFWKESPSRAQRWAEESKKAGRIKQSAVVGAVIHMGNYLNLTEAGHVQLATMAYDVHKQVCKATSVTMAENKGPRLDRNRPALYSLARSTSSRIAPLP